MSLSEVTYVLKLARCKWYVGHCPRAELTRRLAEHFRGHGHSWTRIHPPVAVDSVYAGGAETASRLVRWLADASGPKGWANVRGGPWKSWQLSYKPKDYRPKLMAYVEPVHLRLDPGGLVPTADELAAVRLGQPTGTPAAELRAEYDAWVATLPASLRAAMADIPRR